METSTDEVREKLASAFEVDVGRLTVYMGSFEGIGELPVLGNPEVLPGFPRGRDYNAITDWLQQLANDYGIAVEDSGETLFPEPKSELFVQAPDCVFDVAEADAGANKSPLVASQTGFNTRQV